MWNTYNIIMDILCTYLSTHIHMYVSVPIFTVFSYADTPAVGSRLSHLHLLSGGVLALLSVLEEALLAHADTIGLK